MIEVVGVAASAFSRRGNEGDLKMPDTYDTVRKSPLAPFCKGGSHAGVKQIQHSAVV
jgi:hypothetical protein